GLIRRLNTIQIILVLLCGLIGITLGTFLVHSISRPIQQAIELTDRIAGGDFETKAMITGSDEMNRLGDSLERMRSSLERKTWLNQMQISFGEVVRTVSGMREF